MSQFLTFLIGFAVAATHVADDTSPFKITTSRDDDRVEVKFEKAKAIIVVRSPFGISNAVIERTGATWPEPVVLRLHLKGLEGFKATNGKLTLEAAVSSQDGKTRIWKNRNEDETLDSKSPYWMPVLMIGGDGKPTCGIPLKEGYFELELPKKLLGDNPRSITLSWIDFYRN